MVSRLFKFIDRLTAVCFNLIYQIFGYVLSVFGFFLYYVLLTLEYIFVVFLEQPLAFFIRRVVVVYFVALPWYIFDTFIKPTYISLKNTLLKSNCTEKSLFGMLVWFWGTCFGYYKTYNTKLWKWVIDFLFFGVKRHSRFYKNWVVYIYHICWIILLLCICSYIHNTVVYFLGLKQQLALVFFFETGIWNYLLLLFCFLNPDNFVIFLYTLYSFLQQQYGHGFGSMWTYMGFSWYCYYVKYGFGDNMTGPFYSLCVGVLHTTYVYIVIPLLQSLVVNFLISFIVFSLILLLCLYLFKYYGVRFYSILSICVFIYILLFVALSYSFFFLINNFVQVTTTTFVMLYSGVCTIQDFCEVIPVFFFFGFFFFLTILFSWFFYSYLGLYGIFRLNLVSLFCFWITLLFSFRAILLNNCKYTIKLCDWGFLGAGVRMDCYFYFDTISYCFVLLTTTIALFVFIFAFSYFRYEPAVDRFLLFLLSFVISMLFLVSSGNTIMLYLGWELIGVTSYILINFWTTKTATIKAAYKAFSFNRISDFCLFIFLAAAFKLFYTFDILSLNVQVQTYQNKYISLLGTDICFLEFICIPMLGAAFIKSAQFGGHVWLPDSMEAPVPASALIHSATLVSAGIYLILRFNSFFDLTLVGKYMVPAVGAFTAAYGGVCAATQSDIKKILAYSTISHCGFLMVSCFTGVNEFTILYLYIHGFFKAGVFMCVGNVLRISRGYQDVRRMGGLLRYLPFEYFCAVVGVLNLAGLPFTLGFFIKHLLLVSVNNNMFMYYFILVNLFVGAISGLFYSYRLITYTFVDFKKGNKAMYQTLNRGSYNSIFYTNSSLSGTLAIFGLFLVAYIIAYYMFKYFLINNIILSEYIDTTLLTTYYTLTGSSFGFLFDFSYLNYIVIFIVVVFSFSRYRFNHKVANQISVLRDILIFCVFLYVFYTII